MRISGVICCFAAFFLNAAAFQQSFHSRRQGFALLNLSERSVDTAEEQTQVAELRSSVACQFKILTCTSTSCAKKRKNLGLDEYATFGAFYSRIEQDLPEVQVEESPCLGSCKEAPCVAVEHEDYVGTVALEGMTQNEFSASCFHNIITEEDADRVWSSVKNAVEVMMEADDEDEEE